MLLADADSCDRLPSPTRPHAGGRRGAQRSLVRRQVSLVGGILEARQGMRILIIEDEPKAARYLQRGLSENGYVVDVTSDGEEGLEFATGRDYDLLLVDVMLPRRDGWSVVGDLRRAKATPVIFLTARDQVSDRVKGLELGADDYLVKPFAFAELLARVRSVLRRGPIRQPDI